jgi:hypothetical protein
MTALVKDAFQAPELEKIIQQTDVAALHAKAAHFYCGEPLAFLQIGHKLCKIAEIN